MTTKMKAELTSSTQTGDGDSRLTIEHHIREALNQATVQKRDMLAYLLGMALQQLIDEEIINHHG